jgi:hypothetical protein
MCVLVHSIQARLTGLIPDERAVESFRPTSPILSRRGLRQTPKFGGSGAAASSDSLRSTLDAYTMVLAKVPDMPTPPLPSLEEILYFYSFITSRALLTVG